MANSKNTKNGKVPFWKEWYRLNSRYNDNITEAHKRLKDMYGYNYDLEFNDETSVKEPIPSKLSKQNWEKYEMERDDAKS